jgi:hypothetical protein
MNDVPHGGGPQPDRETDMKTIITSILALGAMTSVALAAEPVKLAAASAVESGRAVLTEQQMDKVAAGVCIGNCPGNKTQVGVNACVITRNCQPSNRQ